MSKVKQIEEMAKDLCESSFCTVEEWSACAQRSVRNCARCKLVAIELYKLDYRKQSVSVEEILNSIRESLDFDKKFFNYNIGMGYNWAMSEVRKVLFEIEQKYILKQNEM